MNREKQMKAQRHKGKIAKTLRSREYTLKIEGNPYLRMRLVEGSTEPLYHDRAVHPWFKCSSLRGFSDHIIMRRMSPYQDPYCTKPKYYYIFCRKESTLG
jgi:hypothetical protein